ncbi:MAG: glycosyltransferase [Candidatus Omnitrophota bacterium]
MTVSIVIAVKAWQSNLEECLAKCLKIDYPDFELIILPDEPIKEELLSVQCRSGGLNLHYGITCGGEVPIRIIPTGAVKPALKRDLALKSAKGEIIAFLDDDAYPASDWLKNALEDFKDLEVAAVGGPSVTPESDNLRQKASGAVYSSFLVGGKFIYRYIPGRRQEVDDYPSCNFLVRKSLLLQLGGFNTDFWPGEDTKLCLEITKKLKKKIIYDPKVLVYHHRRQVFLPHLKQIASYAMHRGYFVKIYPQTSFRIAYFIPSIFLIGLVAGFFLALISKPLSAIYLSVLIFYLMLVFLFAIRKLRLFPLVFPAIILTHLTYGIYFLKGLFVFGLDERS